jgi:hypothetical protein
MACDALASWPIWLPRRLLTIDDLARIFQISPRTARRMVDSGLLPRAPLGRLVRVRPRPWKNASCDVNDAACFAAVTVETPVARSALAA